MCLIPTRHQASLRPGAWSEVTWVSVLLMISRVVTGNFAVTDLTNSRVADAHFYLSVYDMR